MIDLLTKFPVCKQALKIFFTKLIQAIWGTQIFINMHLFYINIIEGTIYEVHIVTKLTSNVAQVNNLQKVTEYYLFLLRTCKYII